MTRGQLTNVYNTASANSASDQNNANQAFNATESDLTNFNNALAAYNANDPYGVGGQFAQDQSTINASAADSASKALADQLNLTSTRTGENTAGYKNTLEQGEGVNTRAEATAQAQSDAQRLANQTAYQQFGINASEFPVTTNENLYGTSVGAANSALGTAEGAAANNQSFGDIFGETLAGGLAKDLTGTNISSGGGGGGTSGTDDAVQVNQGPSVTSAAGPDATAGTGVVGGFPGASPNLPDIFSEGGVAGPDDEEVLAGGAAAA